MYDAPTRQRALTKVQQLLVLADKAESNERNAALRSAFGIIKRHGFKVVDPRAVNTASAPTTFEAHVYCGYVDRPSWRDIAEVYRASGSPWGAGSARTGTLPLRDGVHMKAPYTGTCCYCGEAFHMATPVVWYGSRRVAVHAQCNHNFRQAEGL